MGPLSVGDVFSDTISDICPGQCDQGIYLERRARRLVKRAQGPVSHIHLHPKRAMLRSVWKGKASVPGTNQTCGVVRGMSGKCHFRTWIRARSFQGGTCKTVKASS
jgi:hypothetical protein